MGPTVDASSFNGQINGITNRGPTLQRICKLIYDIAIFKKWDMSFLCNPKFMIQNLIYSYLFRVG